MTPFEPDGVYTGIPYRVLPDASIETMMPGGLVKFKNIDQLLATVNGGTAISIITHSVLPNEVLANLGDQKANVPAVATPLDYHSILLNALKNPQQNSSQYAVVYEQQRFNGYSSMGLADLARHIHEIALAVVRIEANALNDRPGQLYREQTEPHETASSLPSSAVDDRFSLPYREQTESIDTAHSSSSNALQILPPRSAPPLYPALHQFQQREEFQYGPRPEEVVLYARGPNLFIGFLLLIMIFIGTAVIAGTLWTSSKVSPPTEVADNSPRTSDPPAKQSSSNDGGAGATDATPQVPFPLPTSYGVYALSDNKLVELKTLPINVPDARVALSAELKTPSPTVISDQKPSFILFRRDLLNDAPQKVILRVVAHMARETKFIDGKATVTKIDGAWRIRNISYELKVSPVPGQHEMIIAGADNNVSLPAGRYVLVLNRVGYDFTVKGPVTSPAQCIEWFQTVNGSIFSECRSL